VDLINKFGYLAIGVSDLGEAAEFYSRFVRLEMSSRVGRTAFMTGGLEHHWLRLEEGNGQGVKRIGYEVSSEESFAPIRAGLQKWGIEFTEGGELNGDFLQRWLRFVDPGGFEIELYLGMMERGVAPAGNGVTMKKFLHGGLETVNWDASTRFYQEVLGFKASDWIADVGGFFRSGDGYHHSLVLLRAPKSAFNHFCIQVESIDDVMRFRHNAVKYGVALREDVLRHAPSGSIGVYMKDEARGFAVEYCVGHPKIDDTHVARILPAAAETIDVWRAALPEPAKIVLEDSASPAPARSAAVDVNESEFLEFSRPKSG
jgi:catechol 2,3-dioxygenase-like lactoylglutathione lyase family enzyme